MAAYPVLQSGFVALHTGGLTQPTPVNTSLREAIFFQQARDRFAEYYYSNEVAQLYEQWSHDSSVLKSFEYRESLLKVAMKVFGTKNFATWLKHQSNKAPVSQLHKAFLLETLNYLTDVSPRSVDVTQWSRLLEASNINHHVDVDLRQYFSTTTVEAMSESVDEIIRMWSMRESGMLDMLLTLNVIFGPRPHRTAVSYSTGK
jgi:hypothetical protein